MTPDTPRAPQCIVALYLFAIALVGCGGPQRVAAPKWNADKAADKAIELYDTNQDGAIDSNELKKCMSLRNVDEDGDGKVSRDEIVNRVRNYVEGRVGTMDVPITIRYRGKPLPGAKVRCVPEPFMSDSITAASGTTNKQGLALPVSEEGIIDGMTEGFYKVEVTSESRKLPAKYNTETELGLEVNQGSQELSLGLQLDLK